MTKKSFFSVLFIFLCGTFFVFASDALSKANRRTAVRCLKLAQSYLASNDSGSALSQAELGLSYDETVSDLWYVKAAAKFALGETRSEVIPLVMHSLTEGEWVDYNRDGARVLYADLLCDTGNYVQAVAILDSAPFVYSSDAEFIRVKAYYRQKTLESVQKARDKVNSARKMYPKDMRFPRIFFKNEYAFRRNSSSENSFYDEDGELLVQKIADSFIAKMPEYDNPDAELEIYSVLFSSGERKKRLAQAFSSHGMNHPLYAIAALDTSLMTEQEAWDYFCSFENSTEIDADFLSDILFCITEETTQESVREHLLSFSGTLTFDTDGDVEPNLKVHYSRGRPESFSWDKENDGIEEWSCTCDFGTPETLFLTRGNILLTYDSWPFITKAVFKSEKIADGIASFFIADEELEWAPFTIEEFEIAQSLFDVQFFVPKIQFENQELDENSLIENCSSYEIASDEHPGARITFSVLNGKIESAVYSAFGTPYAHAVFKNGLPEMRSLDNDGDGIFETVEIFGYDPENNLHLTTTEQQQVMTNLFGRPVFGSGIYLKIIQLDSNGDTRPDFTEEYIADGGKITTWDFDGDGIWDVRYKRYPKEKDGDPVVEDALFYTSIEKNLVTVTLYNSVPVQVKEENDVLSVTQSASKSFYWIGKEGSASEELLILENIALGLEQGKSVLLEEEKNEENNASRISLVKIGENIFARILPEYDKTLYENVDESE